VVILFDLDETLLDHVSAESQAALAFHNQFRNEINQTAEDFVITWHDLAEKWFELYGKGQTTFQGQRRERLREIFGKALPDATADARFDTYIGFYEQYWSVFPDVQPCLDALRGRKLGVITNGVPDQQNKKLERVGIRDRFAQVICSTEVGVAKPDPEIFRLAAKRFGVEPKECIYVGDRLETDALAATKAGMKGVWLNRRDESKGQSVLTLQSLLELKDVIGIE
jgi:putative hydrolase of the HAD superfamily